MLKPQPALHITYSPVRPVFTVVYFFVLAALPSIHWWQVHQTCADGTRRERHHCGVQHPSELNCELELYIWLKMLCVIKKPVQHHRSSFNDDSVVAGMRSRLPPSGSSTFTIMQTLRENLTAETWGTKPNLWPDRHKIQNVKTDDGRNGSGTAACPQDSMRGLILTPGSHRQFHFSLFPCRLSTLDTNWPEIWRPTPSPTPPPPLCKAPLWLWHPPQKSGPSSRSEDTSEEEFGDIFKPR